MQRIGHCREVTMGQSIWRRGSLFSSGEYDRAVLVSLHLGVHGGAHGTCVSNYLVSEQLGPHYFDVALPRRFRLCRLVALRHPSHSPLFLSVPLSRDHQGR